MSFRQGGISSQPVFLGQVDVVLQTRDIMSTHPSSPSRSCMSIRSSWSSLCPTKANTKVNRFACEVDLPDYTIYHIGSRHNYLGNNNLNSFVYNIFLFPTL